MLLFDRAVSVLIITPVESLEITDLRVSFIVKKTLKASKNEMALEIFNLSKDTRSRLEEAEVQIILKAGYDNLPETIFIGDTISVIHFRRGADIISKIECSDGSAALKKAIISESFVPGTTVQQVVDKLVKSFSVPIKEVTDTLTEQFANGISIVGLAKDALDKLSTNYGFDWSIQDNEVQILLTSDTSIDEEILLTPDTGLLGIPEKLFFNINKLPKDPDNKPTGVKLEALLQPRFRPGRRIRVESNLLVGAYKIETVVHRGDNRGADWLSQIEGKEFE